MGTRIGRLFQRPIDPRPAGDGLRAWRSARPSVLLMAGLALGWAWTWSAPAHAEDVRGSVEFKAGKDDNVKKLGTRPVRSEGFIERRENPWLQVRSLDPLPYLVVVLEGDAVTDEDKKPPGAIQSYELVGESFEMPLKPVVVGTRVKLVNRTSKPRVLLTPDDPSLVDSVSINPRGEHEFKVEKALQPIVITAEDTSHLRGSVVAFPDRFHSLVDERGHFEFKDVPEGTWKVRVFYRDAWLEGVEQTIEVGRKKVEIEVPIPPRLMTSGKE